MIVFTGKEIIQGFEIDIDYNGNPIVEAGQYQMAVIRIDGKDASAMSLGKRGGLVGGNARSASLSAERRSEIASTAAKKRWANKMGLKDK